MTLTEVLAQQQSRIDAARKHYQECNSKLSHLIDQIQAADAWDTGAMRGLSKQLEIAGNEIHSAMQVWDSAINTYADIPETEPATAIYQEWEEAVKLMPQGYRVKDGWFHDAAGGRCNKAPAALTQRQTDILTGMIPVR